MLSDRKRKVIIAVANGDVETVKLNLNKEDCIYPLFEGNSVLIVASQNKTPSIYGMLEFLTEANHYPEGWISLQDNYGLTPLMYCAFHNNLEGMKAWLRIFPSGFFPSGSGFPKHGNLILSPMLILETHSQLHSIQPAQTKLVKRQEM